MRKWMMELSVVIGHSSACLHALDENSADWRALRDN
jgi:hypothetical protein